MNIYASICAVMSEIGAITKGKKNEQQGFMYRGIDDVMNTLQPLLVKHKVFIVPEVLEQIREDRTSAKGNALIYSVCKIKYTFWAEDGTSVTAIVIGEGMDSGDKATNKAMAIAMKYACFQIFCIPTEEMKDPDGESHELAGKQNPQPAAPNQEPAKPKTEKPSDLEKRATAIYYTMTGKKEGQLGWPLEEYKGWLQDFKDAGKISTTYGKKWNEQDIAYLEEQVKLVDPLPF